MAPYAERIEKFDLFGLGEPLIDPQLFERIVYAKEKGFHDTGISTNAHLLRPENQRALLETGIDTIIFSIDGAKKETHEAIRLRTNFDVVVENCVSTIRMRDEGGYATRFVVRFIRQPSNYDEWDDFKRFWLSVISPDKRDFVTVFNMHTWGGKIATKGQILEGHLADPSIETMYCHHLNNMIVLADGSVPLCNEDWLDSTFRFGNVRDSSPIEVFNSPKFNRVRGVHRDGKKNMIPICSECTILHSEASRIVVKSLDDGNWPNEPAPDLEIIGEFLDAPAATSGN
jgi:radical SAM protein with 4Fe4S-binding SPASM domain